MKYLTALTAAATLALGASASAQTLTFDGLAQDGTGSRRLTGPTIAVGDYLFTSTYSDPVAFLVFDRDSSQNADPGGATFAHRWDRYRMLMTRADGGLFDLTSIDVADIFNAGNAFTNELYFEFGDGRFESLAFETDTVAGLQTLLLNKAGLKAFGLAAQPSEWWQIDNIVLSPVQSAVPEPATWSMMLFGFGLVGANLRSKRRKVALKGAA